MNRSTLKKRWHIMSKFILIYLISFTWSTTTYAQVKLSADGPGDTYELINSVLIGHNKRAVEVPDCFHKDYGRHISEKFDTILNSYVFKFVIHANYDKDRCKRFDRQRNEIKANDKSSDTILATEGETLNYQWKFKIEEGFQATSSYTDVHQITYRNTNGNEPLFAFMARKKKGKETFQIVYIDRDEKQVLKSIPLSEVTGKWIVANETITYDKKGKYEVTLTTLDGKQILKSKRNYIQTWYKSTIYARPKWGIYRSLKKQDELRDETLYFADFEINDLTN